MSFFTNNLGTLNRKGEGERSKAVPRPKSERMVRNWEWSDIVNNATGADADGDTKYGHNREEKEKRPMHI